MALLQVIGNIGSDPDIHYLPTGLAVLNCSLAENTGYKGKDGEWVEQTKWYKLSFWDKEAETAKLNLAKGTRILVEGYPDTDAYTGQDGNPKSTLTIRVRRWELIAKKQYPDNGDTQAGQSAQSVSSNPADIPF